MTTTPPPGAAGLDDFRAAQRRHRLGARLRALPAVLAVAVMGIPLSVYLSPVLVALAILITDLVNLVIRMPDLGGEVIAVIDRLFDGEPGIEEEVAWILGLWLIPGVVALTLTYVVIRWRLRRIGGEGIAVALGARPARPGDIEEQQLVGVVGELAVAAGITSPTVRFFDDGPGNALIYGRGPDDATILVGRTMLDEIDREATQGAIARLVASAVDGDLGLATDIGAVYVTYGLLTTALAAFVSAKARARLRAAIRGLRGARVDGAPDDGTPATGLDGLLGLPLDDDVPDGARSGCLTLLTMGGLIAVGMSIVNLFLAGPLLVFAWRSRVYLADALAVDLTRNPTALARALGTLGDGRGLPGSAWLELLSVVGGGVIGRSDSTRGRSLSDTGIAARISPSVGQRLARLERMGAQRASAAAAEPTPPAPTAPASFPVPNSRRRPPGWLLVVIIAPLMAIVGVLAVIAIALIVWLVAIAAFVVLTIVAGPIHDLLRGIAGG